MDFWRVLTCGQEINTLVREAAYIPALVEVFIQDLAAVLTQDQEVVSILGLVVVCTLVLVVVYILDLVAECIPGLVVVYILALVVVYTQVPEGGFTQDLVAECTLDQENHTKATFLPGMYLLIY